MLKPFTPRLCGVLDLFDEDDLDALLNIADSSCTGGTSNDGSTTFEIFENGYDLCVKAGGQTVFFHRVANHGDLGTVFFLIGSEDEVFCRLNEVLEANDGDESEG